jgi:acetylglutamate kinase
MGAGEPDFQVSNAERVRVLSEALPYIQSFRGQIFVVKFGGSAMEDERLVESLLRDVVLLEAVGINPVLVHGGGKAISSAMADAGLKAHFVQGLRVTDEASMEIVQRILDGTINPGIVDTVCRFGGTARGLSGRDVFRGKPMAPLVLDDGTTADLGRVGDVTGVDLSKVRPLIDSEQVPVISPVAMDDAGGSLNVNADLAAAAIAVSLKASKLLYLSDVLGICRDPRDPATLIPSVSRSSSRQLVDDGIIAGGMLPKLRSAIDALERGVGKIHMIDGRIPHSLLLEIFTDRGIGTEIILD